LKNKDAVTEMPEIKTSAYVAQTLTGDTAMNVGGVVPMQFTMSDYGQESVVPEEFRDISQKQDRLELVKVKKAEKFDCRKESNMSENNSERRMVKVIVVDPDERVPLEKCVLYNGDEKVTDLTNQELFFELDIKKDY
jgi:hypothetical protein